MAITKSEHEDWQHVPVEDRLRRTPVIASQPWFLYSVLKITMSFPYCQNRRTIPSCLVLHNLLAPGVMYFTSLVIFPSGENLLNSVCCPGSVLHNQRLNASNPAREVEGWLP